MHSRPRPPPPRPPARTASRRPRKARLRSFSRRWICLPLPLSLPPVQRPALHSSPLLAQIFPKRPDKRGPRPPRPRRPRGGWERLSLSCSAPFFVLAIHTAAAAAVYATHTQRPSLPQLPPPPALPPPPPPPPSRHSCASGATPSSASTSWATSTSECVPKFPTCFVVAVSALTTNGSSLTPC